MLVQKLEQFLSEIKRRKELKETIATVERLKRELLERRKKDANG